MSWMYDPGLQTPKDQVRFKIGDTVQSDPLFEDEEIDSLLAKHGSDVLATSVELVRSLVMRYARLRSVKADDVSIDAGALYRQYKEQLDGLLAEQGASVGTTQGGVLGGSFLEALDMKIF